MTKTTKVEEMQVKNIEVGQNTEAKSDATQNYADRWTSARYLKFFVHIVCWSKETLSKSTAKNVYNNSAQIKESYFKRYKNALV